MNDGKQKNVIPVSTAEYNVAKPTSRVRDPKILRSTSVNGLK
jgi:hypothetical protein